MTASVRRARAESRALRAAAATLAREAENLERAASAKEDFAAQLAQLATIPEAVETIRHWIERGRSPAEAVQISAEVHALQPDCLAHHFEREMAISREMKLWRRDREIMRLAWAGKTNAEIGGAAKLKPKSVSRIIRQKLKAGWAEQQKRFRSPYSDLATPARLSVPSKPERRAQRLSLSHTTGETP